MKRKNRYFSGFFAFFLAAVLMTAIPDTGFAQTCSSLKAQLASLGNGGGSPSRKYLQYERAVRQQQAQISKTTRALRSNNCGFLTLSRTCHRINSSLAKMKANLSSLTRQRDALAPRRGGNAQRKKILRAMQRKGCDSERIASPKKDLQPRRRSLLEEVFGVKTYSNDGQRERRDYDGNELLRGNYNTYRTLCVRTCDGYYFPVSFSTTKDRMAGDLEACSKMCPGTQTALFYHRMPNEDAEQSISYRTGKPYSDLENAFSYRKAVNPECSCKFTSDPKGFEEIAGVTPGEKASESGAADDANIQRIGLPVYKQDRAQDPDTLEAEAGKMDLEKLASIASGNDSDAVAERSNSSIRIVGPAFFPVQ